ncbi:conodipine-P3-like [Haliotis rubra]|uniref:conodipine-P3-like n=1 Tax=Haliotis rubra TaxID=36100 RepID=UPI001EE635B1|nr:conodipine-P3-like [Haliotis rubra]
MGNLAIVLVCIAFVGCVSSGDICVGGDVNGCTTLFKWVPYQSTFRPYCNRHDVCYACGSRYERSKEDCDRRFKRNMDKSCSDLQCRTMAAFYYKAVRVFGHFFYRDPAKSWCGESWVFNCM